MSSQLTLVAADDPDTLFAVKDADTLSFDRRREDMD